MKRIEAICMWIGIGLFCLQTFLLWLLLNRFPHIRYNYSEVIYGISWFPMGLVAFKTSASLKDWLIQGIDEGK